MVSKVKFVLVDNVPDTKVLHCNNPECGEYMIIAKIFYQKEFMDDPHLARNSLSKMKACPYCGRKQ